MYSKRTPYMKKTAVSLLLIILLTLTSCGYVPVEGGERLILSLAPFSALAQEVIEERSNVEIQQRLIELGFLKGKADGKFGVDTLTAVRLFQRMTGLEETGLIDNAFIKMLFGDDTEYVERDILQTGDFDFTETSEVYDAEYRLFELKYLSELPDGEYTKATADAVRDFRKHNGLTVTGVLDPEASNVLFSSGAFAAPVTDDRNCFNLLCVLGFSDKPYSQSGEKDVWNAVEAYNAYVDSIDGFEHAPMPVAYAGDQETCITDSQMFADALALAGSEETDTDVTRAQRRLCNLGYFFSNEWVTGTLDTDTLSALDAFSRVNGLSGAGKLSEETLRCLYSVGAKGVSHDEHRYRLFVSCDDQRVYVYEWLGDDYSKLVHSFVCSTGAEGTETRKGTFIAEGPIEEWHYMSMFGTCWAKWAFRIDGMLLFHSVIFSADDESTVRKSSVDMLGNPASHGCIRLKVEDAKWIYENNTAGVTVVIY